MAICEKTVAVDGRVGLFWETVFIFPFGLAGLIWLHSQGAGHAFDGVSEAVLLMLGGVVTVVPLLLYIIGARGLRLSTMGVMQFTCADDPVCDRCLARRALHDSACGDVCAHLAGRCDLYLEPVAAREGAAGDGRIGAGP